MCGPWYPALSVAAAMDPLSASFYGHLGSKLVWFPCQLASMVTLAASYLVRVTLADSYYSMFIFQWKEATMVG